MALLIELRINKDRKGLDAISLVDKPAILTNFVKLKEDEPTLRLSIANEEQRIVLGPALIPNIKIFRNGKSLGLDEDAYVYFTEETIRELAQIYMEELKIHEVTLDHESDTTDAKMIELWMVEDPAKDKSAIYGFDLPKGTMMVAYKILTDQLWKKIKEGKFNGFSIEASALEMIPKGQFSFEEEAPEDDREVLPEEEQDFALEQLKSFGIKEEMLERLGFMKVAEGDQLTKEGESISYYFAITSEPEEPSKLDKGLYAVRYKYAGPRDEKNRKFCAEVLDADLIYRKEDIDMMSFRGENPMAKQNYSIFNYKGSYNCRHKWVRQVYFAADYEEALNNLEKYINSLNEVNSQIEAFDDQIKNIESGIKIKKLMTDKLDEIEKALKDFKKQPWKGQIKPSNISTNYPSIEIDDEQATQVNPRVGSGPQKKVALASQEDDKEFSDIWAYMDDQSENYNAIFAMRMIMGKLEKAYKETKEEVFQEGIDIFDKWVRGIKDAHATFEKSIYA